MTSNSVKYLETLKKFKIGNDELIEMLGTELHTCPASPNSNQNNCFDNGLVSHLLMIANYAVKLNGILPIANQYPVETVLRVALLSEIGKVGMFILSNDSWKIKIGKLYDYTENRACLRVGQRSIYYLNQAGVKLTETEYSAIMHNDSSQDDQMVNNYNTCLGDILKAAIKLAIHEENTKK